MTPSWGVMIKNRNFRMEISYTTISGLKFMTNKMLMVLKPEMGHKGLKYRAENWNFS